MSICCYLGQCCGFLQGSILVTLGVANLCQTRTFLRLHSIFLRTEFVGDGFFRDTPRQQFSICVPSHGKTKVCTHPVAPSLDTWISNLKCCLAEVFCQRVPVQRPVTDRLATKSLSSISALRFCPRVVLKQLQMTKMVVTPLLILKC